MKSLIINGDDFGMSREVNEGIKLGIISGSINSVSVMVNMPYFEDSVSFLKKYPSVMVGLHFNITEGMPVLTENAVSTLIRDDGSFFYWIMLMFYLFMRKASMIQLESELEAQYNKLKDTGLSINHIDSHHHIHLFPRIFKRFIKFASKNNVNQIRCQKASWSQIIFLMNSRPTLKQLTLYIFCVVDGFFLRKRKMIARSDNFYDINWKPVVSKERFLKIVDALPNNTTEVICHPAVMSETGNPRFLKPRYKALQLLLNKNVQERLHSFTQKK